MKDELQIDIQDEQAQFFKEQGFFQIRRITTDEEIEDLRLLYDEILKQKIGYTSDEIRNLTSLSHESHLIELLPPQEIIPLLNKTIYFQNARKIVGYLLEAKETDIICGWRVFFKPAHFGETAWHQDAAYRPPPHNTVTVWMTLDPAMLDSGCLHYIGGTHLQEVRSHRRHEGHLTTNEVDLSQAVACPLPPGGATIHHCRTLHYAGPNKTDRPRRALVMICKVRNS